MMTKGIDQIGYFACSNFIVSVYISDLLCQKYTMNLREIVVEP